MKQYVFRNLCENFSVLLITEKGRKGPKKAEKSRKGPKKAEKDQKELDKKSRKGPKRTGYIDPKRTIIETKIWIIFTQELI